MAVCYWTRSKGFLPLILDITISYLNKKLYVIGKTYTRRIFDFLPGKSNMFYWITLHFCLIFACFVLESKAIHSALPFLKASFCIVPIDSKVSRHSKSPLVWCKVGQWISPTLSNCSSLLRPLLMEEIVQPNYLPLSPSPVPVLLSTTLSSLLLQILLKAFPCLPRSQSRFGLALPQPWISFKYLSPVH